MTSIDYYNCANAFGIYTPKPNSHRSAVIAGSDPQSQPLSVLCRHCGLRPAISAPLSPLPSLRAPTRNLSLSQSLSVPPSPSQSLSALAPTNHLIVAIFTGIFILTLSEWTLQIK